jgi:hypothetical protein
MHKVDRLISGLRVLQAYKPTMDIDASYRSGRAIQCQEAEFEAVSDADRFRLLELGWWTNGELVWGF